MQGKRLPYDKTHHLESLLLVGIIVGENQGNAIIELLKDNEAAVSFVCRGHGTAPGKLYEIMGVANFKKDIVFSVVRENRWKVLSRQLKDRFSISKLSKGVAFCTKIDSVMCVSIYKMLANVRHIDKEMKVKRFRVKSSEEKQNG